MGSKTSLRSLFSANGIRHTTSDSLGAQTTRLYKLKSSSTILKSQVLAGGRYE